MNNGLQKIKTIWSLALKNTLRWKWRLLSVAALITISFCLQVIYGAYLNDITQSGSARVKPLQTTYYDILVLPVQGQMVLEREQLPSTRYRRNLYGHGEAALSFLVQSSAGAIEIMGLQKNSLFYLFPDEKVEGKNQAMQGEVILPRNFVTKANLQIGSLIGFTTLSNYQVNTKQLELVGIYEDDFSLPPAIMTYEDALDLHSSTQANSYLFFFNRENEETEENNLAYSYEWLANAYPNAHIVSNNAAGVMASSLLTKILSPGSNMQIMIFTFMGIGILTISLMTFLERRREIAALKSIGISNLQTISLLLLEYTGSLVTGLLSGYGIVYALSRQLSWLSASDPTVIISLATQVSFQTVVAVILAITFPLLTAHVASVNQLIFARTIPLINTRINHLLKPEGWVLLREEDENLRFLKLPLPENEPSIIYFKQIGDHVKQGEVVASMETLWGMRNWEWSAICDGMVVEFNAGGMMAIRPDNEDAPNYPYPKDIVQAERQRNETFLNAREVVRKEIGI